MPRLNRPLALALCTLALAACEAPGSSGPSGGPPEPPVTAEDSAGNVVITVTPTGGPVTLVVEDPNRGASSKYYSVSLTGSGEQFSVEGPDGWVPIEAKAKLRVDHSLLGKDKVTVDGQAVKSTKSRDLAPPPAAVSAFTDGEDANFYYFTILVRLKSETQKVRVRARRVAQ